MAGRRRYSYGPYGKVTVYDTSWNPIAGTSRRRASTTRSSTPAKPSTLPLAYTMTAPATTIRSWAGSLAKIQWGMLRE